MRIPEGCHVYFILVLALVFHSFQADEGRKKDATPKYQGEIEVTGLESDVTVIRDQRGMPHIYAGNEHDLYFAAGYVTAQERLWQMDLIRRSFSGRLSEIFGKKFVKTDLFYRCLDITSKSAMVIRNQDPGILRCLESYTEGVNNFILSAGKKIPPEFRILSYSPDLWTMEDIAGIIGLMGWTLADNNIKEELFTYKLVQSLGYEKAESLIRGTGAKTDNIVHPWFKAGNEAIPDAESFIVSAGKTKEPGVGGFAASNNWAVSGKKSATGKPLFSNDMHLTINAPGLWMQMHQVIPGKLDVTGVLIPGEPFIIAGHNAAIAWGMTNMMVDDIDLYAEELNKEDQDKYFFNGSWRDIVNKNEIIKIRGGRQETYKVRFTHRGPIISELESIRTDALSMRWSGRDSSDEIKACYFINRAGSWEDFRASLKYFRSINQNIAYADTAGNIGIASSGGIPIRKSTVNLIRDGRTDEYDWTGYVPYDQLPFTFNPANGQVSSANNRPVSDDYPYYINSCFAAPFRINRIREMLDEKEVLSIDDFKQIINDRHSNCAAHLMPFIIKLSNNPASLSDLEKTVLELLKNWDYGMDIDLVAPSVFEFFRLNLAKNIMADEFGDLYGQVCLIMADNYLHYIADEGDGDWVDNVNTPGKESLDDIVLIAYKDCIKELSKIYGKDPEEWKWGNIHKMTLKHPLGTSRFLNSLYKFNSDEYPVGGSDHTVSMFCSLEPGFRVNAGPSVKNIYNTADWDESFTVLPSGQSGIPGSEFYLSQTKTYAEGGFYKDCFSEEAVKKNARYTLLLKKK